MNHLYQDVSDYLSRLTYMNITACWKHQTPSELPVWTYFLSPEAPFIIMDSDVAVIQYLAYVYIMFRHHGRQSCFTPPWTKRDGRETAYGKKWAIATGREWHRWRTRLRDYQEMYHGNLLAVENLVGRSKRDWRDKKWQYVKVRLKVWLFILECLPL